MLGRYKYPRLQALVKAFADANGLDYRVSEEFELLKMNIDLYSRVAKLPAVPGTKGSRPIGTAVEQDRQCAVSVHFMILLSLSNPLLKFAAL